MDEPIILIPNDLDQQRGYRVGKWNHSDREGKPTQTFDNYECLRCQYSTLFEARMIKHVQEGKHPWAFPSLQDSGLHDGFEKREAPLPPKLVY